MKDIKSSVMLNNGVEMPWIGLGTYKASDKYELKRAVKKALTIGYCHIDTASFYGNEETIGEAIKDSEVHRKEIFLVNKIWNSDQGYEKTLQAFKTSSKKIRTEYLDLYLIHWPQSLSKETWKALEKLYKEGYVRAIGVSNFTCDKLKNLLADAEIMPAVNQVEFHPQLAQNELRKFCIEHNIQLEAWSPLMRGLIFQIRLFQQLAQKYDRTISQIVLRWDLQMSVVTIPKSTNYTRIKENADIFNFEICKEDMKKIEGLNNGLRIGMNPDEVYSYPERVTG